MSLLSYGFLVLAEMSLYILLASRHLSKVLWTMETKNLRSLEITPGIKILADTKLFKLPLDVDVPSGLCLHYSYLFGIPAGSWAVGHDLFLTTAASRKPTPTNIITPMSVSRKDIKGT